MNLRTLIASLLALLPMLASHAADEAEAPEWYTIELVVFTQGGTAALASEQWPNDPGVPELHEVVELFEESDDPITRPSEVPAQKAMPTAFRRLDVDELELGEVAGKLERHRSYRRLLHLGWRQPGLPRNQSRAVHLNSRPFSAVASVSPDTRQPASSFFSAIPFLKPSEPAAETATTPGVEGTIRLYLRRYLHLEADLLYENEELSAQIGVPQAVVGNPETSPFPAREVPVSRFRLKQQRRLRSGEIHYLDHPLFGLIVKVTPFELPPEPEPIPQEINDTPVALPASGSPVEKPVKQP